MQMDTILILRKKEIVEPAQDRLAGLPPSDIYHFFFLLWCVCAGCAYLNGTGEACLEERLCPIRRCYNEQQLGRETPTEKKKSPGLRDNQKKTGVYVEETPVDLKIYRSPPLVPSIYNSLEGKRKKKKLGPPDPVAAFFHLCVQYGFLRPFYSTYTCIYRPIDRKRLGQKQPSRHGPPHPSSGKGKHLSYIKNILNFFHCTDGWLDGWGS